MPRLLLAALLALTLTVGVAVWLHGGPSPGAATGAVGALQARSAPDDPALERPSSAPADPRRLPAETAAPPLAAPPPRHVADHTAPADPPAGFVGRVLGPDGAPVVEARVVAYHGSGGYAQDIGTTRSDGQGRFATRPANPGVYELRITAPRLELLRLPGLRAGADDPVDLGDVTMEQGRSVSGRVRDPGGAALADVEVDGAPASGNGRLCSTRTDDDGRFTLWLPEAVPYDIEVRAPGRVPFASGRPALPGEQGLDIVLASIPGATGTTTLIVRDAATGAPLTRFGARDWQHTSLDGGALPRGHDGLAEVVTHATGRAELQLDPRTHGWEVNAPGYATARGRLEPGEREVVVALPPEAVVTGRVVTDDEPLPGARVVIERRPIPVSKDAPEDLEGLLTATYDLGPHAGRRREVLTDEDGAFRIMQLQGGTWQLGVEAEGHPAFSLPSVALGDGETRDLGALTPPAFATITGRVLLPAGFTTDGLAVRAGARGRGDAPAPAALTPDGRFTLRRVPPVATSLWGHAVAAVMAWELEVAPAAAGSWPHRDPRLEGSPFLAVPPEEALLVKPGPGETIDVVIDLRARVACARGVVVRWNGAPLAGAGVALIAADGLAKQPTRTTDADGLAVVATACDVPLTVHVTSPRRLASGSFPIPAGRDDVDVELEAGRLVLLLPEALTELPAHGGYLNHWPAGGPPDWGGTLTLAGSTWADQVYEGSRRIDLGPFAPGTWDLLLRITGHEWSATATVVAGGHTEVVMAP